MMAGRRVARRRLASFVQQLDGSGGGSLLLARRQKSVVAKIGGVIKDSSSSSSSSLESFESQSGAFCPFFGGGEKFPFIFLTKFLNEKNVSLFFLPKTHFFLRLYFFFFGQQNHSTKNVRLKIAFLDRVITEHKRILVVVVVVHKRRRPQTNPSFSRLERQRRLF